MNSFFLFFFGGLIFFTVLAFSLSLHKPDGMPLQRRNLLFLSFVAFFAVVVVLALDRSDVAFSFWKALVLTCICFPLLLFYDVRSIKRRLKGHELAHNSVSREIALIWIIIVVLIQLEIVDLKSVFPDGSWIAAGLVASMLLWSLGVFAFVMNLEKKLGQQIIIRERAG